MKPNNILMDAHFYICKIYKNYPYETANVMVGEAIWLGKNSLQPIPDHITEIQKKIISSLRKFYFQNSPKFWEGQITIAKNFLEFVGYEIMASKIISSSKLPFFLMKEKNEYEVTAYGSWGFTQPSGKFKTYEEAVEFYNRHN